MFLLSSAMLLLAATSLASAGKAAQPHIVYFLVDDRTYSVVMLLLGV